MEMRAEAAYKQSHDQRAAGKSEFYGLRHINQRYRPDQYAERYAEKYGQQLGFAQFLERVAQNSSHLLDSLLVAYNHHAVTHLQLHTLIRNKVEARTVYARYVDAVLRP